MGGASESVGGGSVCVRGDVSSPILPREANVWS